MEIFEVQISKVFNYSFIRKSLLAMLTLGLLAVSGCDSPTSSEDDSGAQTHTFDLILSSDNSTKIGEITTSKITEDSDAYIDEGFFVTITLSGSGFNSPFDLTMNNGGGVCGTWDVQPDEKAEMPCDYDNFLKNPGDFIVTEDNGSGDEAYAQEQ